MCDICEKNVKEESSYEMKLRSNESKMTKAIDVCHDCVTDKGILEIMSSFAWKEWDNKSRSWVKPQK